MLIQKPNWKITSCVFLFIAFLHSSTLRAQVQSLTWQSGGAANHYKSAQKVCRAADGYLECNTPASFYFGFTSKAAPSLPTHLDFGVFVNTSTTPNRLDFYTAGLLKLSYNTAQPLAASHKVRLQRSGSLIELYYQSSPGGAFLLLYSYNSDANGYYRFHAICPPGASPAALNAQATTSITNPCSVANNPAPDATLNWTQVNILDGSGQESELASQLRTYSNRFGYLVQSQSKNFASNTVLATETVYDAQGRSVLQSLAAPTGNSQVQYQGKFLQAADGTSYDYADFDLPAASGAAGEVNNPKPVGNQANTVGRYYSTFYTADGYVPTSAFPYRRIEYAADGTVRRLADAGEQRRLGSGHEARLFQVNAGQELNYFYGGRRSFEVNPQPNDPLNDQPGRTLTQHINATKTVSIDPDGLRTISYHSASGLLLARCVSGRPETYPCPNLSVRHTLYTGSRAQLLDEFGTGSVNIHLPAATSSTLQLTYDPGYGLEKIFSPAKQYCNGSAGFTGGPAQCLDIRIFDLAASRFLVKGTDFNLTVNTTANQVAVTFLAAYANKEGFYRISCAYTCEYYQYAYDPYYVRGYEPPLMVTYQVDYSNWTINYFDQQGRLRRSVSPQGIDCSIGDPAQHKVEKLSYSKDFYTSTTYPASFEALNLTVNNSNANYGPELNFAIRTLVKSGTVSGPSGGNGTEDGTFDSGYKHVDRKTPPNPVKPTGGGTYETYSPTQFATIFNPPTDLQTEAVSYVFPVNSPVLLNDPNNSNVPSSCLNGKLDPGEIAIDWGGPCGFAFPNNPCTDPPQLLVSFRIKVEVKKSAQVLASHYLYRTLGVTCDDKLIEMPNPAGQPSEVRQVITNAQIGSGSAVSIALQVAEIKVLNESSGAYDVAYNPAAVSAHRFIRYILLKTDLDKETNFLNANAHSLKTSNHFNQRGELLATTDPDRGRVEFIYDDEGKLRFWQDARQRSVGSHCFSYINYDARGRIKQRGQVTDVSATPYFFPQAYYEQDVVSDAANPKCLLNTATRNATADLFAAVVKSDVGEFYYDQSPALPAGVPAAYRSFFAEGRLTRVDNAEQSTCYRYNHRGEVSGTVLKYNSLGANDINYRTFDFEYDFFGRLKKSTYQAASPFQRDENFSHLYTYDVNGDLLTVETVEGTQPARRHLRNTYYKTGALRRSVLGYATQGLDYVYTLDGRLKSINHPLLGDKDPGGDGLSGLAGPGLTSRDAFALGLDYYPNDYVRSGSAITYGASQGSGERYDGRIKSLRWNTRHGSVQAPAGKESMYRLEYDWEQNLVQSVFGAYTPNPVTNDGSGGGSFGNPAYGTFTPVANNGYTEQAKDATAEPDNWYDRNGNLRRLKRYKGDGTLIDDLTYQYAAATNRLTHVQEAATFNDPLLDHVRAQVANNYLYDANGNIKEDLERDLKVEYNAWGRASAVRRRSNNQLLLTFHYDALGNRVRKVAYDAGGNVEKSTLYLRDGTGTAFGVFEDRVVAASPGQFALTEIHLGGGSLGTYFPRESANNTVYRLSDHLGNVRVTVGRDNNGDQPNILSYADYYPWGMSMPGRELAGSPRYRLGYQGQEFENKVGMYGFSLRLYDQRLGRWFSADPYGQHWSPYLAMSNNPASYVDPDGGWDGWWDRSSISYFIDGYPVGGWMIGPTLKNEGADGTAYGTIFSLQGGELGYLEGQGWGFWEKTPVTPQANPDATMRNGAARSKSTKEYTTWQVGGRGARFVPSRRLNNGVQVVKFANEMFVGVLAGVPKGLGNTLEGMYEMVSHPINTLEGIGSAVYHYDETWKAVKATTTGTWERFKTAPAYEKGEIAGQAIEMLLEFAVPVSKIGTAAKIAKPAEDFLILYRGDRAGLSYMKSYAARKGGYAYSKSLIQNEDLADLMIRHAVSSEKYGSPFISTTSDIRVARAFAGETGTVYTLKIPKNRAIFNTYNKMELDIAPNISIPEMEYLIPNYIKPSEIIKK